MTVRLLTAAVAIAAIALPAVAEDGQKVALTPTPAQAAITQFTDICLANFPSAGKVKGAIGRSSLGFAPVGDQPNQWRAPAAVVGIKAIGGGKTTRCDFDAMLTEKIEPGVLAGFIEMRLIRALNARPPHRQVGNAIVWEWNEGGAERSLTIDFTGASRQLALSLASA